MDALEAGDLAAQAALELIGKLSAIERDLPPLLMPGDDPVDDQLPSAIRKRPVTATEDAIPGIAQLGGGMGKAGESLEPVAE